MPTYPIDLGPAGERVAQAVKAMRLARGLTQTQLAEAVTAAGRPMAKTGVNKLELGQRRVDADYLMALALALDVSPLRLLLPTEAPSKSAPITKTRRARVRDIWRWARGERPLPERGKADPERGHAWRIANQPDLPPLGPIAAIQYADDLHRVAQAVAVLERQGIERGTVLATVDLMGTVPMTEEGSH